MISFVAKLAVIGIDIPGIAFTVIELIIEVVIQIFAILILNALGNKYGIYSRLAYLTDQRPAVTFLLSVTNKTGYQEAQGIFFIQEKINGFPKMNSMTITVDGDEFSKNRLYRILESIGK